MAGLSVLPHYERLKKYNVAELVGNKEFDGAAGEVNGGKKERIKQKEEKETDEGPLPIEDEAS